MVINKRKIIFILIIVIAIPILLFAFYKPSRVIWPGIFGLTRIEKGLYLDEPQRADEARWLWATALQDIEKELGQFKKEPKIIFCSEQKDFEKFGFKKSAARSVGPAGIVISPRAWKIYYIKHELIHCWQTENLGMINIYFYPQWLREGMAYSLSGDPRETLDEPWQTYRKEFNQWYEKIDKKNLLKEIKAIRK